MAFVRFFKFDTDGFQEEHDPSSDELEIGSLKLNGNIDLQSSHKIVGCAAAANAGEALVYGQSNASLSGLALGNQKLTGVLAGTNAADGVNVEQLDTAVITGGRVRELLLHQDQLSDPNGFYAAMAMYFTANPTTGQLFTLTDGTTTRSYGAGSGGDVQYTIGATAADTMQNLANAITNDASGAWDAVFTADGLDEMNAGGVVVIHENTTAAGDSTSRAYGNASNAYVVEYAAGGTVDIEYDNSTGVVLPGTDPSEGRFGTRHQQSALEDGEIHAIRVENYQYMWDDSQDAWRVLNGPGSIPDATSGSGGGTKGKLTVDSDYGLLLTGGVLTINLDTNPGLEFDGVTGKLRVKVYDGIAMDANGIQVDLATGTPDPGLQLVGTSPNKKLAVLPNGAAGIKVTASGVEAILHTSPNSALSFDGTSGGIKVGVDGTSIHINSSNELEVLGASEADHVRYSLIAGAGGVTKGDPIYVSGEDTGLPADADNNNVRRYVGIAKETAAATNSFEVQQDGVLEDVTIAGSPSPGDFVFIASGGGLTVTLPGSNKWRMKVGIVKGTSPTVDMIIEPQYLGKGNIP